MNETRAPLRRVTNRGTSSRTPTRSWLAGVAWTACVATVSAQAPAFDRADDRDHVVRKNGKVESGRIHRPFDQKELLVLANGRRTRVPRADVERVETVADVVAEFLRRRQVRPAGAAASYDWILVEWAIANRLPRLARLQAMEILFQDPDHVAARTLLGHRASNAGWLWPVGDDGKQFVSLTELDARHSSFARGHVLRSEHFQLQTDADLATAVGVLFDLETLHAEWIRRFGQRMNLSAIGAPIDVHVHRDREAFPGRNRDRRPYYDPPGSGDIAYAWLGPGGDRRALLAVVVQPLLYRTLAETFTVDPQRRHVCTWVEIGLGSYVASLLDGPPGRMRVGIPKLPADERLTALRGRAPDLKNLTHVPYARLFDTDEEALAAWGRMAAFVHFLMLPDRGHEDAFLRFVVAAFRDGKGDSSRELDRALGTPVERLDPPFLAWLHSG